MVLMGINQLPEIRDYWAKDPSLHYSLIADRVMCDRFEEIARYLHFVDNDVLPAREDEGCYHRLQKILPIVSAINKACIDNYRPNRENSIDEAMIPFKGCSSLKQYVPLKPVKRGFKVWVRADSWNGYFCEFEVYTAAVRMVPQAYTFCWRREENRSIEVKNLSQKTWWLRPDMLLVSL